VDDPDAEEEAGKSRQDGDDEAPGNCEDVPEEIQGKPLHLVVGERSYHKGLCCDAG